MNRARKWGWLQNSWGSLRRNRGLEANGGVDEIIAGVAGGRAQSRRCRRGACAALSAAMVVVVSVFTPYENMPEFASLAVFLA